MNYKHTLIAALLLFASFPCMAQIGDFRNNWAVGINGGMNLNQVTFDPKIKQELMQGIVGGVTVRYISEKYFAMICGIQTELNFSQRGWTEKTENSTDTYSRRMNYMELPLLAHLAFGKEPRGVQFFVNLGPQLGFLINEKESYSENWNGNNRPNGVVQQYGMKAEKKFEYGIVGGLGIELKTKAGNFLLEGRYFFGLSDVFGNSKKDVFGRSANSTISAKLSYLFDLTN